MDDPIPAEELPRLYRAVLDTIARLEHAGDRAFAFRLRRDAVTSYSTRWDEHGRQTLISLDRKAHARLAGLPGPATRPTLARSTEPA